MTEDELKQFNEVITKFEPKDKEAVITAIKEKAHDVFQEINDGGRAAANAANKEKLTKAEEDLKAANAELEKAQKAVKDLDGKTQGAAELREKYEKDLQQARQDFDTKAEELGKQLGKERHKNAVAKLVDSLVTEHQIEREYAETIIAQRADVNDRIAVDDKGRTTVWKDDSKELPLVPPDGQTAIDLLAKQIADKVDPKWKTSRVKKGSASRGSGGDNAADEGDTTEFDEIRKETQERYKPENQTNKRSGLERLGQRR